MGKIIQVVPTLLLLFTFTSGYSCDADVNRLKNITNEYIDFIRKNMDSNIFEYDST